jgi:hypothetical protein
LYDPNEIFRTHLKKKHVGFLLSLLGINNHRFVRRLSKKLECIQECLQDPNIPYLLLELSSALKHTDIVPKSSPTLNGVITDNLQPSFPSPVNPHRCDLLPSRGDESHREPT